MSTENAIAAGKITINARVFRIDWARRPRFVPVALWLALGKRRVPFTGRWHELGEVASSEAGTASMQ